MDPSRFQAYGNVGVGGDNIGGSGTGVADTASVQGGTKTADEEELRHRA